MGVTRITLPRLGETMEEARVTEWLKAPGEAFRRGDVLLEVETDKTVVEVPALQDGTLVAQLVQPGEMVSLDQPIAEVEVEGVIETAASPQAAPPEPLATTSAAAPVIVPEAAGKAGRASPLARRLAREAGLDLSRIAGSGRRGRVMGDDVRALRASGAANRDGGPLAVRHLPAQGAARTPVMMLHGLYDEGRGWRDLPDRLARAGHPVIVPDLPGHGASLGAARTVDEAVDMLADLVPEGAVRLVGHSFGAALAAMIAARIGPRAERLVLIAPAGLGVRMDRDFLDVMASADTPDALRRAMALLGGGPISEAAMQLELDRLRGGRPAIRPLAQAVAVDGMQQLDIAPILARLACPVSAVFGLDDRIVDWRDCANLPASAAIHLVRGAGHLPHIAAAELVAGLITGAAPLEREMGQARKG
jgi:pyruvate dehydrogenase E2 component (dihydrolipoamide acetyltransferase)